MCSSTKSLRKMFNKNIYTFHLLHLGMMFCTSVSQQMVPNGNSDVKLSRQRRYLIFPTGSSVQLVYEFGVTIPDYTFYLTTGITVALAWNLPDKPTYPEHEHKHKNHLMIQHKNDGNSNYDDDGGTVNGSLITVINTKSNATRPTHLKLNKNDIVNRIANYAEYYFQNRRPDSYYFGNSSPVGLNNNESSSIGSDVRPPYSTLYSKNPSHDATYMIETYLKPWIKSLEIATKLASQANAKRIPKPKPTINRLHVIHPALKKRYVRETATPYEQKFYLDHHRQTRHRLYKIIEKYLFAKGYNGTECVLKTLCEVRQKQHETQPGSFLVEIIRAVFSLPVAQLQNAEQERYYHYDKAHQIVDNCAINFPLCSENIWSARFIIESDATIY